MFTRWIQVVGFTIVSLLQSWISSSTQAADELVFNSTRPTNDLSGSLEAQVLFAQSQIFPARTRPEDKQPHLTGLRKTLLLVRPLTPDRTMPLSVVVRNAQGDRLGTLDLQSPEHLPKSAYYIDDAPNEPLDFTPARGTVATVRDPSELKKLDDEQAVYLLGGLKRNAVVDIDMADGRWVRNIYLPDTNSLNAKMVRLQSQAGYESTIFYSGRRATLSRGKSLQFKCVNNQWLQSSDLENNGITYATDAWSGLMPAEWIVPGISVDSYDRRWNVDHTSR